MADVKGNIRAAKRLRKSLDNQSYPQRERALAQLTAEPGVHELIEPLSEMGQFEFAMAVQLAIGVGADDFLVKAIASTDFEIRTTATTAAVARGIHGSVLVDRFPFFSAQDRHVVYRLLRQYQRSEIADQLIELVTDRWGEGEAGTLLPACSAVEIKRRLFNLGAEVAHWRTLSRQHPKIVLDYFREWLAETPESNWNSRPRHGVALGELALTHPGEVLTILETMGPVIEIPSAARKKMATLARFDSQRVVRLLTSARWFGQPLGGRALWEVYSSVDDSQLVALGTSYLRAPNLLYGFIKSIAPQRRSIIFSEVIGDRNIISDGHVEIVDLLPEYQRAKLVESLLQLPNSDSTPGARLAIVARQPWLQINEKLLTARDSIRHQGRVDGWYAWLVAVRLSRDPTVVADTVNSIKSVVQKQDSIRLVVLEQLCRIPPWLFSECNPDAVASCVSTVLAAEDLSIESLKALKSWVFRVIIGALQTGKAELLDHALSSVGRIAGFASKESFQSKEGFQGLSKILPFYFDERLFGQIEGPLHAEAQLTKFDLLQAFTIEFGSRAYALKQFIPFFERALVAPTSTETHASIIKLWLSDTQTQDARLAKLLSADPSIAFLPSVLQIIESRRTDLYDNLIGKKLRGKFEISTSSFLPFGTYHQHKMLPRQQRDCRKELVATLADGSGNFAEKCRALTILGAFPESKNKVASYLVNEELGVSALQTLAAYPADMEILKKVVDAASIPYLLPHAPSAIQSISRYCPDAAVSDELNKLLDSQVVSLRQNAIRLYARGRLPHASAHLQRGWSDSAQPKLVKRTIVAETRWLLADPAMWALLADSVDTPEIADVLATISPHSVPEIHRLRYGQFLVKVATQAGVSIDRYMIAALNNWAPWQGETAISPMVDVVGNLQVLSRWRDAIEAVINQCLVRDDLEPMYRTRDVLLGQLDVEIPHRDQSARQRLAVLTCALRRLTSSIELRSKIFDVALQLIDIVPVEALDLALRAINWSRPTIVSANLAELSEVLAGSSWHGVQASNLVAEAISMTSVQKLESDYLALIANLSASHDELQPLLAVRIAGKIGTEMGWTPPWQLLIKQLRNHSNPVVALVAATTVTAVE